MTNESQGHAVKPASRTEIKEKAQELLMDGIGNVLGYWAEKDLAEADALGITEEELTAELRKQADRVAKMFGYERAWSN